LNWANPSPHINVIIGENASGKTFLLKALYTAVRAVEEYKRGNDNRNFKQVLDEKLYWTFQTDKIGDLVRKGQKERLSFSALIDDQQVHFDFSAASEKGVGGYSENLHTRDAVSLFLPAKEVLSLFHVIKKSRGVDKEFGFDDTYYDLVKALEKAPTQGKISSSFSNARKILEAFLVGRVHYENGQWALRVGNQTYPIHQTAEGYKRISILDRLIVNRTLSPKSFLFFDEPDAVLHPTAILATMEALGALASSGMQIFMATHSYFVLKKLFLMAKSSNVQIQVLSLANQSATFSNLAEGMPENSIIETSVQLYEEELGLED